MNMDWDTLVATLVALVVGALLNKALESRPRLITYLGHVSAHVLRQPNGTESHIYTHSVVIRNTGRKPAKNVRLAHQYLPAFNVYPDVEYHVGDLPGGGKEIVFPVLVPEEQITVSYLYSPPITWDRVNGPIKSDEGMARVLRVLPTPQFPQWVNMSVQGLVLIGLSTLIYGVWSGLRWIMHAVK